MSSPKPYTLEEWGNLKPHEIARRPHATIEALFARLAELEAEREKLAALELEASEPLPCGHPAACVSSSDEGTSFCRWCEDVGRLVDARAVIDECHSDLDSHVPEPSSLKAGLRERLALALVKADEEESKR